MMEKQFEEMVKIAEDALASPKYEIARPDSPCPYLNNKSVFCDTCIVLNALYDKEYRKQSEGEWEWFEEWSPSTTEHPRECYDCGWRCGKCGTALEDVVGGYWDDPEKKPNLNFCPECGAHMKGGES